MKQESMRSMLPMVRLEQPRGTDLASSLESISAVSTENMFDHRVESFFFFYTAGLGAV